MEPIELTANNVNDATAQAAKTFNVDASQVTIEVLEEIKGLFGKSSVRVKASVSGNGKPAAAAPAEKKAPARRGAKKDAEPVAVAAVVEEAPAPAKAEKPARPARGAKAAAPVAEAPAEDGEAETEERDEREDVVASTEDAAKLTALLTELLEKADLQATIKMTGIQGRYVNYELDGADTAYLVGKHGEVLNSLQYMMNVIAGKQLANGVRVVLDGNQYRHRREEALSKLASQIAEQVKSRGEEAVLDALPAFERRVVHKALQEITGITTYSEGEEPNRRVVIAPAS